MKFGMAVVDTNPVMEPAGVTKPVEEPGAEIVGVPNTGVVPMRFDPKVKVVSVFVVDMVKDVWH